MELNKNAKENTEGQPSGLLGEVEKKLYSRENEIPKPERTTLRPKRVHVEQEWSEDGDISYKRPTEISKKKSSFYVKLFLASLLFFVLALMLAVWNMVGKQTGNVADTVKLSLYGPVSVRGGDTLSIQVMIENTNTAPLTGVVVGATFPDGARYPNNPSQTLQRSRKSIDAIQPGEVRTETISAVLLGADNTKDSIDVYIEFGVNGGSVVYKKDQVFNVSLTASPMTVKTGLPDTIASGQEMILGVDALSNSPAPMNNGVVKIDYPAGFTFEGATPPPSSGNNVWNLGSFSLGDSKHIDIKGKIEGDNGEQKIFRLYNGVATRNGSTDIGTMFGTILSGITIQKPFLNVELWTNGNSDPNYILDRDSLSIAAYLKNTLPDKVTNSRVEISLRGDIIDKTKVRPLDAGTYDGNTGVISWDERMTQNLAEISAGGKTSVSFSLGLLPFVKPDNTVFKNPVVEMSVNIKGNHVSQGSAQETITSIASRSIKIATTAKLLQKIYYWSGALKNTGPIPPKAGQQTTYTVNWQVSNTVNDISSGRVVSKLPSYVSWIGQISPLGANISYDPATGNVTWILGKVLSGTGYNIPASQVSFQIGFNPVVSQVGTVPTLLLPTSFSGNDDFTGVSITDSVPLTTTTLQYEPQATPASATVKP